MALSQDEFRVAAVQACPVYLDREATVEKTCSLIRQAGAEGATLVVFPEAFLPGYPVWCWFVPPGHTKVLRELYAILLDNSITIPSAATDRLSGAARDAGVTVAIGVNERNAESSGSTLFNTLLYIGSDGTILGKHRKLVPSGGERLVWGQGDGSDLEVFDLPFGRLGGLLCWENYMPLARYAMCAWGTEIFVAPTWDRGEPWLSTLRHVAKEGRCIVVGCCTAMQRSDVPDHLSFKEEYLGSVKDWINPGHSVIVDPDGKFLAGPAEKEETILYADVQREMITGPRFQLDAAGHYARPDVFQLRVDRRVRPFIEVVGQPDGQEDKSQSDAESLGDEMEKV
jgi:nitrilase